MKTYKVNVVLSPHSIDGLEEEVEEYYVLDDSESVEEAVQMAHGNIYDVNVTDYKEVNNVMVSNRVFKKECSKYLHRLFDYVSNID